MEFGLRTGGHLIWSGLSVCDSDLDDWKDFGFDDLVHTCEPCSHLVFSPCLLLTWKDEHLFFIELNRLPLCHLPHSRVVLHHLLHLYQFSPDQPLTAFSCCVLPLVLLTWQSPPPLSPPVCHKMLVCVVQKVKLQFPFTDQHELNGHSQFISLWFHLFIICSWFILDPKWSQFGLSSDSLTLTFDLFWAAVCHHTLSLRSSLIYPVSTERSHSQVCVVYKWAAEHMWTGKTNCGPEDQVGSEHR